MLPFQVSHSLMHKKTYIERHNVFPNITGLHHDRLTGHCDEYIRLHEMHPTYSQASFPFPPKAETDPHPVEAMNQGTAWDFSGPSEQ